MCGIFGYANWRVRRTAREVLGVLLAGLQRVEYRGYDSAGVCVDAPEPGAPPVLVRSVGNIACLREDIFDADNAPLLGLERELDVHTGIAHTRWATHGPPAVKNCHPQVSNNRLFAVVHNGIITNFMKLREMLLSKGYHFTSDTDTEVIVVLVEELYKQDPSQSFAELAAKVTRMTEGAYAILLKSMQYPNELVACRKSSPLAIGIRRSEETTENKEKSSSCEVYFASDINSFSAYTNNVIFLEDDDVAHYSKGEIEMYTAPDTSVEVHPVARPIQIVDITPESFSKGKYAHFMLKEIHEQTETVGRSMHARVDFATRNVTLDGIDDSVVAKICNARRIMLVACGTSYHSCLAARPIFEDLLPDIPFLTENAPDFMDRLPRISEQDVCVFVSQSGETADTLYAMQHCKKGGALLIVLTNVTGSSMLRLSHYAIPLCAGVEVGVASTKAYTSQIVVLTLLALRLCQSNAHTAEGERIQQRRAEIVDGLAMLPGCIAQCLKSVQSTIVDLSSQWVDISSLLIIGRGFDYATAVEGALKIKEICYVYTEGIHSGELKHGPLALIDNNAFVIALCAEDCHIEKSMNALQQVSARGGRVVVITTMTDDAQLKSVSESLVHVPKVVDCLQVVVNIVPLQLLSYYLALVRGLNVDCPRNLAKSVTV